MESETTDGAPPPVGAELDAAIELIPDAVVLVVDGVITSANSSASELLGAPTDDSIVDVSINRVFEPAEVELLEDLASAMPPGGQLTDALDAVATRLDGSSVRVHGSISRHPSPPSGLLLVLRDGSDRQELEAELDQSEATASFLADNSANVLFRVDEQHRVLFVSSAASEVLEHAPSDLVGVSLPLLFDSDDRPTLAHAFEEAGSSSVAAPFEGRAARSATGAFVWVRVEVRSVLVLGHRGEVASEFHVSLTDITAEREQREALAKSERWMRTLVHGAPIGIFELDGSGRCTFANDRCCEIVGAADFDELSGRGWIDRLHPVDRLELTMRWESTTPAEPTDFTLRFVRPDGSEVQVEIGLDPLVDDDGEIRGSLGTLADVTERLQLERDRAEAHELFSAAFEHAPAGLVLTTVSDPPKLVQTNSAQLRLAGMTLHEFKQLDPSAITHPDDVEASRAGRRALINGEIRLHHMELRRRFRPTDPWRWYSLVRSVVRDHLGEPLYVIAQMIDVNERIEAEQATYRLAVTDELTGLSNRRHFDDRLAHAHARLLRSEHRIGVVFLDLDHFKTVNDVLGHKEGDRLLEEVAEILLASVRPGDTVARFGGDEFAVIAEHEQPEDLERLADRLSEAIEIRRVLPDGTVHRVTASVGAASRRAADAAPGDLVELADEAMYVAKRRRHAAVSAD
ncbi:MAG: PAS domain S-box protein [Actinomycetota bacterium]